MSNKPNVSVSDEGGCILYKPSGNPVIKSIAVPKDPSSPIVIYTQDLVLDSANSSFRDLPNQMRQALLTANGASGVETSTRNVAQFRVARGDGFQLSSMLENLAEVKYPLDNSPLLTRDAITQILTKSPKIQNIPNPSNQRLSGGFKK